MQNAHAKASINAVDLLGLVPKGQLKKMLDDSSLPPKQYQGMLPIPPGSSLFAPLVTCVLVIQDKGRIKTARQAVECFVRQVYSRKQLVIINGINVDPTTDTRVTNVPHPDIVERRTEPGLSIGMMRNRALDTADGDWIMLWDEDDYSHPFRIAYQMAHRVENRPVLLSRQLRVNLRLSTLYYHDEDTGVSSTMLHPKTAERYPDISLGEDLIFWVSNWAHQRVVVDNSSGDAGHLAMAFYHGRNATPQDSWMARCPVEGFGKCNISASDVDYVREVFALYGLALNLGDAAGGLPPVQAARELPAELENQLDRACSPSRPPGVSFTS